MTKQKKILVVNASDAGVHINYLRNILNELVQEQRIESFTFLNAETIDDASFPYLKKGSMAIILLTEEIEKNKAFVEQRLLKVKEERPNVSIAEIIIDQVPYEPQFIAFPKSLIPLNTSKDIEQSWEEIAANLRYIYPVTSPFQWMKYLPYAIGVLLLVIIIILWKPESTDDINPPNSDDNPMANVELIIEAKSSLKTDFASLSDCPNIIEFEAEINVNQPTVVEYYWMRSDGSRTKSNRLEFEDVMVKIIQSKWNVETLYENRLKGWQKLIIIQPQYLDLDKTEFEILCRDLSTTKTKLDIKNDDSSINEKESGIDNSKEEKVENDDDEVPFAVIENVPVFPGCENEPGNNRKKKCMSDAISKFVNAHFNQNIAQNNNLSGRQKINVIFKIDKTGDVNDIRARAPHPALEEEAKRVISLLPRMKPGKQRGIEVIVPYSLPIVFQVSE